ncbi:MAG: fibronectin type III domain-containing protein [Deltaproteobacteria bacterium]|nr:fibronectin type III domain-containing protein [Deltaproteobacteria bacterium]
METKRSLIAGMVSCFVLMSGGPNGVVQAAVSPPELTVLTNDSRAEFYWNAVDGASGYTFYYALFPYQEGDPMGSVDVGNQTNLSITLWPGAAFHVAVTARDSEGESEYSNFENFRTPSVFQPSVSDYQVFAFNDLGMHCYDPDFSVFSLLPPYNVLHAQVVQKGNPPQIIGSQVEVTYRAMADSTGSINTTSQGKTNFWEYVHPLFGANLQVDEGLLGANMPGPGNPPQSFVWTDGAVNWFSAAGIPITSLDDGMGNNPYPLMNVRAIDPADGTILSSLSVVVPVSDEMACDVCHLTGNDAASRADIQWSNNSDLTLQYRENILILHDYRNGTSLYASQPVLCSTCHYSFALDLAHQGPVGAQTMNPSMSKALHSHHASRITELPPSGNVCFYCHPGENTQCARGAMDTAGIVCLDCHGNMFAVGRNTRQPWIDLPRCESCHTGDALSNFDGPIIRQSAYNDSPNVATFITAPNKRFAEQDGTLFRNSVGHHGIACESCHGSTHAIWPSREENDNLTAIMIQGHEGMIIECASCHDDSLPLTPDGGPHGLHNVNSQSWVHSHEDFASQQACAPCHGAGGEGTVLSKAAVDRVFNVEDNNTVAIPKGTQIGCDLCHENMLGPGGNDDDDEDEEEVDD